MTHRESPSFLSLYLRKCIFIHFHCLFSKSELGPWKTTANIICRETQDLLDGSAGPPSQGAAPAASEGFMDLFGGGTNTAQAVQACAPMVTWQEVEEKNGEQRRERYVKNMFTLARAEKKKISMLTLVFAGKCA